MVSRVKTAVCEGIDGRCVNVEADISNGLPAFNLVGLAATMVKESQDRVKAAIINSGFRYPRGRMTVNLFPAGLHKSGSHLDLPIALAMIAEAGEVDRDSLKDCGVFGEMSLDGTVMKAEGLLPMMICLHEEGIDKVIVPADNYRESMLAGDMEIIPVTDLEECASYLNCEIDGTELRRRRSGSRQKLRTQMFSSGGQFEEQSELDFSDIRGQENAKRAACIAAAGGHGMIMIGFPGCGKTMLAERMRTIMPDMSLGEVVESTIIYSAAGKLDENCGMITERPFRKPYHTISPAALLGGGLYPVPGEITLAHNGVLFLDEICEFDRRLIERLRVPLEEKEICHSRRGNIYRFPCRCLPVFASNPCPCGYFGDSDHVCRCTSSEIDRYMKKLSGAILDRIDLQFHMDKVDYEDLASSRLESTGSDQMRESVMAAVSFARNNGRIKYNADLNDEEAWESCMLGYEETEFLNEAYSSLAMSPRTCHKVLKTARTIADMEQSERVRREHLLEAMNYRVLSGEYLQERSDE